ncbi:MAG TPA: SpoIIE family protein phosphatase [Kofleriaceae bacterium]|nr:SpoIIE family protein phosphatase [Kofleriaceae bacterium]
MPLSVRLIVATSLVVAVAVGTSAFLGYRTIESLANQEVSDRGTDGRAAIERESDLLAEKVAAAAAYALAQSAWSDVQGTLDAALREDTKHRIEWMMVTDASGQVVAKTGGAPVDAIAQIDQRLGSRTHAQIAQSDFVYAAPIALGPGTPPVGRLRMGVTTAALDQELAARLAAADADAKASIRKIWLIAALVLLVGILFAALEGVSIARPLKQLTTQAQLIASGRLDQRVPAERRDEIGVLARNFNTMASAIGELLVESQKKAMLEREMSLARSVQQAMLPPPELVQFEHLKIIGYCNPAAECGGDWWTYRKLSSGRVMVVVGDATGHGMHSAMIAGTARGAVEALAEVDEKLLTPELVLRAIDSAIRNLGDHQVLMTCFATIFDSHTGQVVYANAGQNFPYVMRMGPGRTLEDATIIAASGNPLGDRTHRAEIKFGTAQLHPGDLFVAFTDGLVERQNKTGKLFGDRRLRSAIHGQVVQTDGESLVQLRDRVLAASEAFAEGVTAEDDVTFVLCQFDPPAASSRGRSLGSVA